MNIKPIALEQLDKQFQTYTNKILSLPEVQYDRFIKSCSKKEAAYKQQGFYQEVAERFAQFAQRLINAGKMHLAGIVYSRIVKFKNIPGALKEQYIIQALKLSESQNDLIHTAARLEDLHQYYDSVQDWQKSFKTLLKEEQALKEVINDFDTSLKNFQTIKYRNEDKTSFETLLASIQVDIAKTLVKTKPRKAILKLRSAMEIFKKLNDKEGYDFAYKILIEAEHKRYKEK